MPMQYSRGAEKRPPQAHGGGWVLDHWVSARICSPGQVGLIKIGPRGLLGGGMGKDPPRLMGTCLSRDPCML